MMRYLAAPLAVAVLALAPTANATTYTLEPWEFGVDGLLGLVDLRITATQLGGTLCPCTKIPYPSDLFHQRDGAAGLAAKLQPGDTALGFSGGANAITWYLHDNTPPPGTNFVLLGSTNAGPNGFFNATGIDLGVVGLAQGQPVSPNVAVPVNIVARQYDGWSDFPNNPNAPGYTLAAVNAAMGGGILISAASPTKHDYKDVRLNDPANVVVSEGNITYTLVPSATLPINDGWRSIGLPQVADYLDNQMRPLIEGAYNRPGSTTATTTAKPVTGSKPVVRQHVTQHATKHAERQQKRAERAAKRAEKRAEKQGQA